MPIEEESRRSSERQRPFEEKPDQQGEQPPKTELVRGSTPDTSALERAWFFDEDELSPKHIRGLGHLLYGTLFEVEISVAELIARRGHPEWESDEGYLAGVDGNASPPAEFYVENFAKEHGLPVGALKRWVHQASHEFAAAHVRTFRDRYQRATTYLGYEKLELAADAAAVARVCALGIHASIADHRRMRKAASIAGIPSVDR